MLIKSVDFEKDENQWLDSHWNSENLHFRSTLDGITHYLIWLLVFIMPLFIPYFEDYSVTRGSENPSLFQTALIYCLFAPLCAWMLFRLVNYFQKRKSSFTEKILLGTLFTASTWGLYLLLCNFELLPNALFYSSTNEPLVVWFSSFSNGKYFFTYTTIILITAAFLLQQYSNKGHLVIRFPLRKIIGAFFFINILSLYYAFKYPTESLLNEGVMRIHQWIQYFLLFIILVNTSTSLGRLLSIAKASSASGSIVALIGIGQQFFTSTYEKFVSLSSGIKTVTTTFVMYNPGEHQPFSTFGHNNFAAAYVCLATPITLSIIGNYLVTFYQQGGTPKAKKIIPFLFFVISLLAQTAYLAISLGKAGIVSMLVALIFCGVFMCFLLPPSFKNKIFKLGSIYLIASLIFGATLTKILLNLPATSNQVENIYDKWHEKISKSFDLKQGSNRVRLSYVGGALSISLLDFERILFGVGPNNYKYHYPLIRDTEECNIEKGKHVLQAHCDIAQSAADTGILGFLIFCLLIIYPIISGAHLLIKEQNIHRKTIGLGLLCTLVAMGVNSFFFFPFQTPGSLLPYFISLGLLFSYERNSSTNIKIIFISKILLVFLSFLFFSYEAWYYSRLDNSLFWGRLFQNSLLLISALSVLFVLFHLTQKKSASWPQIIVLKVRPALSIFLFLIYLSFSHFHSFSYLYTDYIKYSSMGPLVEQLRRTLNKVRQSPNTTAPELRKNYSILEEIFNEVHAYRKQAIRINPHNPDIYLMMAQAITYKMNLHGLAFSKKDVSIEEHKKYWTLPELQDFYVSDILAADKTWPNSRDQYYQLSQGYYHSATSYINNFDKYYELLNLSLKYARKSLDIWPNDLYVMDSFLSLSEKLGQIHLAESYYNLKLSNNPFITNETSQLLTIFFQKNRIDDLALEIRIKDFVCQIRKKKIIEDLHFSLKKIKSKKNEKTYPKGILHLLELIRHDGKSVIENLKTNRHAYMEVDAYNFLMDLLIQDKRFSDAEDLQNFYIPLRIHDMDIKKQINYRLEMKEAGESLDSVLFRLFKNNKIFRERSKLVNKWSTAQYLINIFSRSNSKSHNDHGKKIFESYICHHIIHKLDNLDEIKRLFRKIWPNQSFSSYLKKLHQFNKLKISSLKDKNLIERYLISIK